MRHNVCHSHNDAGAQKQTKIDLVPGVCVVCASTSACVPPLFAAHADVYCFIIETFKTYNLKQFICTRRIWLAIIRHTSIHHRHHSCRLCVTMPTFNGTIQSANETITKNCTCVNCFFPFFRSF